MKAANMPTLLTRESQWHTECPLQHSVTADMLIYLGHVIVGVTNSNEDDSDKTWYERELCFCHPRLFKTNSPSWGPQSSRGKSWMSIIMHTCRSFGSSGVMYNYPRLPTTCGKPMVCICIDPLLQPVTSPKVQVPASFSFVSAVPRRPWCMRERFSKYLIQVHLQHQSLREFFFSN